MLTERRSMILDANFWMQIFSQIIAGMLAWLPNLVGALVLILLGWVIARLAQLIVGGLLRRLRLDQLAERAGLRRLLDDAGVASPVTHLIAILVYWLILLLFIVAAAESLGLTAVGQTLISLVTYLPNVLAAALIVLLGGLLARLVGEALSALAIQSGIAAGPALGQLVRYVLVVFVIILALEQLGVETTLLITATMALIGATALALALAFGIGSRDLARNIMAGFHAKDAFALGQHVRLRGYSGQLVNIGPVKSVLETEAGLVSLPNFALIEEDVTIVPDHTVP